MIEALACGTPVIAWRNGSVPEIIEEGNTGFIADNIDDAVRAVGNTAQLSRAACRTSFEDRFDAARMASNYETVYHRLLRGAYPQFGVAGRIGRGRGAAARMVSGVLSLFRKVGFWPQPDGGPRRPGALLDRKSD